MRGKQSYTNILGKLHTNSVYISHDLKIGKNTRLDFSKLHAPGNIATLRANELNFYKSFFPDVNSEEEFFNEIRSFFEELTEVKENILVFNNANLSAAIDKYVTNYSGNKPAEANLKIEIIDNTNKQSKEINRRLNAAFAQKDKNSSQFKIELNLSNVKTLLNAALKRNYHVNSKNYKNLMNNLPKELDAALNKGIQIGSGNANTTSKEIINQVILIDKFPWQYSKKMLDDIGYDINTPEVERLLREANEEIKHFIFKTLPVTPLSQTPMLERAMEQVWDEKIGNTPSMFFMKGGAYKNGLKGALGEFQVAVISQYIYLSKNSRNMAKIVGDELEKNRTTLPKTDVEIVNDLGRKIGGIQVKNYKTILENPKVDNNLIKTSIQPKDFSELLNGDTDGFLTFVANLAFNKSFEVEAKQNGTYDEFTNVLEKNWRSLYNFALTKSLLAQDKVNFYFIGGTTLVPASRILESVIDDKGNLKFPIEITYGTQGNESATDTGFAQNNNELAKKYWNMTQNGWETTEENENLYNNLIERKIAFRTKFSYTDFMSKYSLF